MRKILLLSLFSFAASLFLSLAAQAQTSSPEKEPTKKAPKAESEKEVEDSIDLDSFFKKGEENAKTSSCDKPAKPADPIA